MIPLRPTDDDKNQLVIEDKGNENNEREKRVEKDWISRVQKNKCTNVEVLMQMLY